MVHSCRKVNDIEAISNFSAIEGDGYVVRTLFIAIP